MTFLNRLAAAQHLNERGIAASKTTLARMAMHGEGPQYVIIRQRAYYKPELLWTIQLLLENSGDKKYLGGTQLIWVLPMSFFILIANQRKVNLNTEAIHDAR